MAPLNCRPQSCKRSRRACRTLTLFAWHWSAGARHAMRRRRSPCTCRRMCDRKTRWCDRTRSTPTTSSPETPMTSLESLRARAHELRLHGLLAHWTEVAAADWIAPLVPREEPERTRPSLERRLQDAHIGSFKALSDFDWPWPKRLDRAAVEELMTLG